MKIIKFNSTEIRIEDPKDGEEQKLRTGHSVRGVKAWSDIFQLPADRGLIIFWMTGNAFGRCLAWDRTDSLENVDQLEVKLSELGFRTGMNMLKCKVWDAKDILQINLIFARDNDLYIQLVPDPHCTVID